jgi:hypothetical protein
MLDSGLTFIQHQASSIQYLFPKVLPHKVTNESFKRTPELFIRTLGDLKGMKKVGSRQSAV